jgi:hypothetical protein
MAVRSKSSDALVQYPAIPIPGHMVRMELRLKEVGLGASCKRIHIDLWSFESVLGVRRRRLGVRAVDADQSTCDWKIGLELQVGSVPVK